ncbi:hypothetical protein BKA70DRAFT_1285879 [Coprinopsis sp. MPI-PUGE-AT-0042]|nr:hypothetical protein BKA70DRAFT_1285879 [Coprinopsis sp. MPI-PUGE-AT-0042]
MASNSLETGIYAVVNAQLPQWTLDVGHQRRHVVANPYISSPSQQWKFQSSNGVSWYIQNVASGRYLGFPIGEYVRNFLNLQEVDHEFAWHIEWCKNQWDRPLGFCVLHVPYTKFVICLDPKVSEPGKTVLYLHDDAGSHKTWHLSKDLHLKTSSLLRDRRVYKILNAGSYKAITVKNDHTVACFECDDRKDQTFQAVQRGNGWAFQSVKTKEYLGIQHTVIYPDDNLRLSSIAMEFPWMVTPYYEGGKFTIWVPFTQTVLHIPWGRDVHGNRRMNDDSSIHLISGNISPDSDNTLWQFEEVQTLWCEERTTSECVTGERRLEER